MQLHLKPSVKDSQIAALAALAIGIHVLESVLPSPLPGIKPGFANIITLIAYAKYGLGAAAWVSALRVLVGSLVIGSFLSPTFILSISGAMASIVVLWFIGNRLVDTRLEDTRVIDKSFIAYKAQIKNSFEPIDVTTVAKTTNKKRTEISLFGIAILMAMAHMLAQFIVVYTIFVPHAALINILPIMLSAALIFGALNGVIATKVYEKLVSEC